MKVQLYLIVKQSKEISFKENEVYLHVKRYIRMDEKNIDEN